jgi:phage terminase large subunit-like protein
VAAVAPDVLRGSAEPRIWTPPLRELTPETSLGFEAIRFGSEVLGMSLFPWQEYLLIAGLELEPGTTLKDPLFRFDTVIALAARQNGKTEDMKVLALWKIFLDRTVKGTTVIGTAQDLGNSEKAWGEAIAMAEDEPMLAGEIEHVVRANGLKSLRLIGNHQYLVKSASRRGARGFTGDLVMLDELREHQSWDAWGASTKTTLARPRSQVWCFSNAGDAASIVLWRLRAQAMQSANGVAPGELEAFAGATVEADDGEDVGTSLGIFEWSAPPKASIWDRSAWAQANPSMGYSITERKIAAAARTDPEWVFRTEVLCQWRPTAAGGPFPDGSWEQGITDLAAIDEDSPIAVCIDVSRGTARTPMSRSPG